MRTRAPTDIGYRPQLHTKHTSSKLAHFQTGNDFRRAPLHASKAAPCPMQGLIATGESWELNTQQHNPFLGGPRRCTTNPGAPAAATGSSQGARTACGTAASSPPPPKRPGIPSILMHSNVLSSQEDQVCHINPPSVQKNTNFTTKG